LPPKRHGVEITDVTQIASSRRRGVQRWLAGAGAPPSLQAQLVLMISAFLLGGVLTSLLFVGIWRHTAADGERARAAQVAVRHQLHATQQRFAAVEAELGSNRAALAKARGGRTAAAAELMQLRRLHRSVERSLRSPLQGLTGTTGTLAHDTSALRSEIAALRAYLQSASPTGADSGFLDAQIKYLVASTENVNSAVSRLEQQTQQAQAAAAKLGKPAH
jgi:chromosome segregation ATPase